MKAILTTAIALATSIYSFGQITMNIDATRRGPMVSEYQYGLFFEEINHAGEGGLYAELVKNRSFDEGTAAWTAIGGAKIEITESMLLNEVQKHALMISTSGATQEKPMGVMNSGYWGMNVVKDSTYTLTLWARGDKGYTNNIKAQLRTSNGNTVLGEAT
ncbi:MAG: carbohydrate binding domain-containing protein, partial [Prevotella sp.]|nr:carbohydrate binding domain-containing protein [Prevotella sp.]